MQTRTPTRPTRAVARRGETAAKTAAAVAPRAYGIDFLDRASAEAPATPVDAVIQRHAAGRTVRPEVETPAVEATAPGLVVGPADDRAEVAADRRAAAVVARLHAGPGATSGESAAGHGNDRGIHRSTSGFLGPIGAAGGALEAATEQRVEACRGRGDPLTGAVRRRFEGAFGRSFAGINVHRDGEADALARHMSATAFTTGDDIFFSRGAYRPGDAAGDRLLAHELAHVEQGGAGARRTIRRAVGFEFETNISVVQTTMMGLRPYPKAAVLKHYGGYFRMEADENEAGSNIEFVVDPPVAENNRVRLVTIMNRMYNDAKKIQDQRRHQKARAANARQTEKLEQKEDAYKEKSAPLYARGKTKAEVVAKIGGAPIVPVVPRMTFAELGIAGASSKARVHPRNVLANPQVTGGVSFDKLFTMQGQVGQGGDNARAGLSAEDEEAATQLDGRNVTLSPASVAADVDTKLITYPNFPGLTAAAPSDRLKALAVVLVTYLRQGVGTKPLSYAKLISAGMMMRSDLGAMVERLAAQERQDIATNARDFADWILNLAGLSGQGNGKLFERGFLKDFSKGVKGGLDDGPTARLTRYEWLEGAAAGDDFLSAARIGGSNRKEARKLEGLGRLGDKFDRVGVGGAAPTDDGVILEFRGMSYDLPVEHWKDTALRIFDYIVASNQ